MSRLINNKTITRTAIAAIMAAFCLGTLNATIVKAGLTGLLGSVSPVPATAQDAFGTCVQSDGKLAVNAAIRGVKERLEALIRENAVPYGMEDVISGKGTGMPSADEIDGMSDAEKMALAMKLQKDMGFGGTLKVRDTQAWGQCIKLNNELAAMASDMTTTNRLADLHKRVNAEHDAIFAETEASLKTCPLQSTGEMSVRDPKCVKAKKLAGADRHIAVATRELAELRGILAAQTARVKPLVARADALIARVKHGEGMDNQTRTPYNQMQGLALQQIMIIQVYAMESYTSAAQWVAGKKLITE